MSKNRKQRQQARRSKLRCSNYFKWKNSPKKSARIKNMIFTVAKSCDDESWPYPHLPWHPHPMAYYGMPQRVMQRDARILRKVKRIVGDEAFKDIKAYLDECECMGEFEITTETGGNLQSEDWGFVDKAYIDQSCGYSGDDYSGHIWIPITPKRYLRFFFTC